MTIILRRAAVVWLALGTLVFVHGAMTGSGLAGVMLYHQLVTSHEVSPMTVSELLIFPLCVFPLVILIATRDRTPPSPQPMPVTDDKPADLRRGLLLGGLFGGAPTLLLHRGHSDVLRLAAMIALGIAAVCLATAAWDLLEVGERLDYMPLVNLDTEQAFPPVSEATIAGAIHPQLALDYAETGSAKGIGYGRDHRLVPLTSAGWTPLQPVRVLLDTDRSNLPPDGSRVTRHGFVSTGVPGYVRRVYADQRIQLADDVVVLRAKPDTKIDSILLAFGVISLGLGFALAAANRRVGIPPLAR